MKYLRLLVVLILPLNSYAQGIRGFIYDAESTVKGAKILNTTQNILTYSDDKGSFQINAKLNDTISVTSYFHTEKLHVVAQIDLNMEMVIELKKVTNTLDEVLVNKTLEKKPDAETINNSFSLQLANDVKNRPYLYGEQPSSNIDFMAIGKLIGKLFKKRGITEINYINSEDLIHCFEKSGFFNMTLLQDELNIPEDYQFLFFEYCSAQNLNSELLLAQNEFMLLEALLTHSKTFNQILRAQKKD